MTSEVIHVNNLRKREGRGVVEGECDIYIYIYIIFSSRRMSSSLERDIRSVLCTVSIHESEFQRENTSTVRSTSDESEQSVGLHLSLVGQQFKTIE